MTNYYEARETRDGYIGVVYTYRGNSEVVIHKTRECDSEPEAIDAVTDWLDDTDTDAELG